MRSLERVNKELWLILSMFIIAMILNFIVDAQRMMVSFYTLPTLGSAYLYGRRHATFTAFASVLLVVLLTLSPSTLGRAAGEPVTLGTWLDLSAWGGILVVTGYLMGSLYEHKNLQLGELRETYNGVLTLLQHFISKDEYTEHHSYRVSVYASRIAAHLRLSADRIEDVRAAGLLHDIGKLDISRDLLYKAAQFTPEEYHEMQTHVDKGVAMLETVGGSLRRVIPIVLVAPRQVRWIGLSHDSRRRDPARGSHHFGGGCVRLVDQRPSLSQGHVAVRGQGHSPEGPRHRLRSLRRRRVCGSVQVRRNGRQVARGRLSLCCNGDTGTIADAAVR